MLVVVRRGHRPFLRDMELTLSKSAIDHVHRQLKRRGKGLGIRVGVRPAGCSGWAYVVDYADTITPEDHVYEAHGVKVVVDSKSLPLLDGTELDFSQDGLNASWMLRNPNVKSECGCGESFSV